MTFGIDVVIALVAIAAGIAFTAGVFAGDRRTYHGGRR